MRRTSEHPLATVVDDSATVVVNTTTTVGVLSASNTASTTIDGGEGGLANQPTADADSIDSVKQKKVPPLI